MKPSYAIVWQNGDGARYVGRLELTADGLRFVGNVPGGAPAEGAIERREIESVDMAHAPRLRLDHRPTVLLALRGGVLYRVASLDGPGTVHEIARGLAASAAPLTA